MKLITYSLIFITFLSIVYNTIFSSILIDKKIESIDKNSEEIRNHVRNIELLLNWDSYLGKRKHNNWAYVNFTYYHLFNNKRLSLNVTLNYRQIDSLNLFVDSLGNELVQLVKDDKFLLPYINESTTIYANKRDERFFSVMKKEYKYNINDQRFYIEN